MNSFLKAGKIMAAVCLLSLSAAQLKAQEGVPPLKQQTPLPAGTWITTSNWQQYQDYMGEGLQWLFSAKYFWHPSPTQGMEVAEPIHINLPKAYLADTEKYGSQTRITKTPEGGGLIENYQAGIPFPHPSGPLAGSEMLWNVWYRYNPAYTGNSAEDPRHSVNLIEDSFHNLTRTSTSMAMYMRLGHLSDPPYPMYRMNPFDFGEFITTFAPEQSKYTSSLILFYLDPTKSQEQWSFSPSLRRVLRLSAAARCAPQVGTDLLVEDSRLGWNGTTGTFIVKVLEHKKYLGQLHLDVSYTADWDNSGLILTKETKAIGLPDSVAWPPREAGKFEKREGYALDIVKVPSQQQGYCYGRRIIYADAETWTPLEVDLFDSELKPWKMMYPHLSICHTPGRPEENFPAPTTGEINQVIDFQNSHQSVLSSTICKVDTDYASYYMDLNRYAKPAGLAAVMR